VIEVNKTYEFLPGIDKQAYVKVTGKLREAMLRVPGLVELYSQRNILGSPSIRLTLKWKTLADWAKFAESAERWTLEVDLNKYVKDIKIEIWEPLPIAPKPPHASK
jgi:hypothetical protein